MHHTRPKASRRLIGAAIFAVLLTPVAAIPNQARPSETSGNLADCESSLRHLIALLESEHQLTGTKHRYTGPALGADYSKCRILQPGQSWPRYSVFRSQDDVTVVIEKRVGEQHEPALFGPFRSAYRK
jgi:hypothetical protein